MGGSPVPTREGYGARRRFNRLAAFAIIVIALAPVPSQAQQPAPNQSQQDTSSVPITLPPVNVTATPLLPGLPDLDKVPSTAQVFNRSAVTRDGYPALLRTLDEGAAGVSLDQAQGNPWQPNLIYHGFEASPLVGDAQGLAVYVNGSRFNQPFGDTTNWDLIPDIAIDRIDLVGSNPAYGLNALGGALAVRLRDGFTYQGAEATILGGSFGRVQGSFQYGIQSDNTSAYVAGTLMHDGGWRDFSPSTLRQIYGDIGWRSNQAEVHLNIIGVDNDLVGNGTTPVDLLSVSRSAIFTFPDETRNKYVRVGLSGTYAFNEDTSVQVNAYYSNLSQRTFNGDAADVEPCDSNPTIMCQDDGPPLASRGGNVIPNFITNSPYVTQFGFSQFADGGPYALLNQTATDTNGYGIQAQIEHSSTILGMTNHLIVGGSYDGGSTQFSASTALGGLSLDRGFVGPGIVIVSADGSITPVQVHTFNNYYGLFVTDTLDITPRLSATASARFNSAQITLQDQLGTDLNGSHSYNHLNPAVGLTYKILPSVTVYGGYAMTNRAPTPAELSCADPQSPCSLTNFFVGDPNLQQVVAQTLEAGVRGSHTYEGGSRLEWNLGVFRTTSDDDILFVSSETVGRAFFRNVGTTRRQGVETGIKFRAGRLNVYANYAFTDATFQSPLTLSSPDNPLADAAGNIQVQPGNRIPGIPRNLFKVGADYGITDNWILGFSAIVASGKYLVGDESNLNPTTGAYGVVNIHSSYQITKNFQVFALMENALNVRYATFGTFAPVTEVPLIQAPGSTNTRSLTLAPPISVFGGVRATF
jgi:outer membrane receptor protein involved in Fe transport